MTQEVLATVSASVPRRWLGVGMMGLLGALLLYIALSIPPDNLAWQAFLIIIGLAALYMAEKTRRATERVVELTSECVRLDDGQVLTTIDKIDHISRGMFAMKPSNGFVMVLNENRSRAWQPGLWWAFGKRVGIGGVTPGSQTKFMAQILEAMIAERNF
ncbi:hypothetical protein [uncultured Shimia sp.]|uniref:hypothetical protein n=1 Tax=uncultured Shimia sp. TaxID=573152 RepID=UPI00260D0D87|nr:hypothetical protein [uncultured Shimia sp.]